MIWHPDKNRNQDTHDKMVDIIEAYSVLSDSLSKKLYDEEYTKYKQLSFTTNISPDYDVTNKDLNDIIIKARFNASEFMKHFKHELKNAGKGAFERMIAPIIVGVVLLLLGLIIQAILLS